jgi:cation diffusion facilitator CzcD-associated flavoprotein CzcO
MPQPTPAAPPPPANLSLWQRTILTHPLLSPSPPLPPTSDIVVIGGGLCGAALAHSLLTSDHDITVTLLEARTLASGASGRNAGHCRPDPSRGFTSFAKMHGTEESRRVLASERVVFDRYVGCCCSTGVCLLPF